MKAHLSLFGIPVRFDPTFFFLVLLFGYFLFLRADNPHGTTMFVLWIPIVTAAILLHELGHALVGRAFGLAPFIVLHGMGGLTTFDARQHRALTHGRRILITLAGPAAGIAIGALTIAATLPVAIVPESVAEQARDALVFTTLGWGILNLFPMMPLDGGHIVATVLEKLFGHKGVLVARVVSIVLAIALGVWFALIQAWWMLFVVGSLGLSNWRAYKLERGWQRDAPLEQAIKDGFAALEAGDTARVRALAEAIAARASAPQAKAHAAHLLAWAHLLEGDAPRARAALATFPAGHRPDAFLEGSVLLASGTPSRAIGPLVEALVDRGDDPIADTIARAVAGAGRLDELVGLLESSERSERVGALPLQRVTHRLFTGGHFALAAELGERLFERFGQGVDAFNAACSRVRLREHARAVRLLERAIDAGLEDPSILDTDEDLEPLRGSAEMDALRRRAGLA